MPSGKLCSRQLKKTLKTTHYESRVQSNTHSDLTQTNIQRELWEVIKNIFEGGGWGW